jgi:hypothetical protein
MRNGLVRIVWLLFLEDFDDKEQEWELHFG